MKMILRGKNRRKWKLAKLVSVTQTNEDMQMYSFDDTSKVTVKKTEK